MTTHQLHFQQHSYSHHLRVITLRQTPQGFIVKEAPHQELSTLEGHQPWNMTCCTPMTSTNISITYTVITTTEMSTTIIGVMTSRGLEEVLQLDLY